MSNTIHGMEILSDSSVIQNYNLAELPAYISFEDIQSYPDAKTVPHWNDALEVLNVTSGSMYIIVSGQKHLLREQDICLVNAGCVNYLESNGDNPCKYFIGVADESIFSSTGEITKRYLDPVFHSFHPNFDIIPASSPFNKPLQDVFRKIERLRVDKPIAYDLSIVACCHEFLAIVCNALKETFFLTSSITSKADSTMQDMLSFIHENYSRTIHIEDLCEAGKISRNQCFHLFNKYTGDTPNNYILKFRLNSAKSMLITSDVPLSQIATSCGFAHQSHFTNHFTKYYGITPLQYRKAKKKSM